MQIINYFMILFTEISLKPPAIVPSFVCPFVRSFSYSVHLNFGTSLKMRWSGSGLWWLVLLAAVMILEDTKTEAAPNPQPDDVLNTLLKLDRIYSSVARPR